MADTETLVAKLVAEGGHGDIVVSGGSKYFWSRETLIHIGPDGKRTQLIPPPKSADPIHNAIRKTRNGRR